MPTNMALSARILADQVQGLTGDDAQMRATSAAAMSIAYGVAPVTLRDDGSWETLSQLTSSTSRSTIHSSSANRMDTTWANMTKGFKNMKTRWALWLDMTPTQRLERAKDCYSPWDRVATLPENWLTLDMSEMDGQRFWDLSDPDSDTFGDSL